jgi:hypothetical protein
MLELWIADLMSDETSFTIPGAVGAWEFNRRGDYASILAQMQRGQCAPTFYAGNAAITHATSDADFMVATGELIDACLVISFLTSTCVTPKGSTQASDAQFVELGDHFIRPRAIAGFPALTIGTSLGDYFSRGMPSLSPQFQSRRMRLFLSHWISGLTCFSMEDLFLSVGVQMDIVKQCEIAATGGPLDYYPGMVAASQRFGIAPLSQDYKAMRNCIVHEGVLSGSKFPNRTKAQCADVIADTLNWIDRYVAAALSLGAAPDRWLGRDIAAGLPSLTV